MRVLPLTSDYLEAASLQAAAFCRARNFVPLTVTIAGDATIVHVRWDAYSTAYAGRVSTAHAMDTGTHHHELEDDGLRVVAIDLAASREIVDGRVTL
jgi:hypothetical protein